ncbi:MAG: hypothetical protein WDN26_05800 [Chitinophagaceae bacterium]
MSSLPQGSQFISLEKAVAMTKRYRTEKVNVVKPEYQNVLLICETFNRQPFEVLLAEKNCVGIRIYFGMDEKLTVKVIAVGVDESDADILPSGSQEKPDGPTDRGEIVEEGVGCPPTCPPPSPLNEDEG